jgi:Phospholipase_D-nuclease N-terminal/Short C-terminal domain
MVIAADYPFMDVLWTMIIFFAWVAWIILLVRIIADVFRRKDISGWGKAAWTLFVIVLPFLGTLVYLIANGSEVGERDLEEARAARAQFDDYVRTTAGGNGAAAEIEKAKGLLDSGAITQAEFDQLKARVIS